MELHPDPWLTDQLRRPCFRCDAGKDSVRGLREDLAAISAGKAFAYARVGCDQVAKAAALQDVGFRVVDVNLGFSKPMAAGVPVAATIRDAEPGDEEAVARIAHDAYRFSRFHLDPAIGKHEADALKREWVRNYFRGRRGDRLFVAVSGNRIAGFLLALRNAEGCVIDLIAVAESARGGGIGSALIAACERAFAGTREISAGTQAANIASVRLYERLGFRLHSSQFLLHWHK